MLRHVILDTSTEKKGISIIDLSAWFQNHGLCAENILCAGVWHIEIKKNTSKPWNRLIFLSNIKIQHKFEYDLNAILSDLIYTRVLEPSSKSSSFWAAKQFLEPPTYELHDVYRALSVLASEMDFIQSEVYKNSFFLGDRMDRILYYDCTNYYFEI